MLKPVNLSVQVRYPFAQSCKLCVWKKPDFKNRKNGRVMIMNFYKTIRKPWLDRFVLVNID